MSELQKTGQGKAPAPLPCAICRDLLPLVQDGVASSESEAAVRAHLACCPACRALWPEAGQPPAPLPDDEKIVRRLRARMDAWLLVFAVMGLLLGVPPLAAALWLIFVLVGTPYGSLPEMIRLLPGAVIMAALYLLGVLAAALLKYAFGGKNDED